MGRPCEPMCSACMQSTPGFAGAAKAPRAKNGAAKAGKGKGKGPPGAACSQLQQKDMGLTLFHALGKILYNKRYNADGKLVPPAAARCGACGLRFGPLVRTGSNSC